jgi:hypothetical protein
MRRWAAASNIGPMNYLFARTAAMSLGLLDAKLPTEPDTAKPT